MAVGSSLPFRSPLRKLVVFFQRSRDKWKEKCKNGTRKIKSLKICLAKMKESRDRWRARAMALEEELKRGTPPQRAGTPRRGNCPR